MSYPQVTRRGVVLGQERRSSAQYDARVRQLWAQGMAGESSAGKHIAYNREVRAAGSFSNCQMSYCAILATRVDHNDGCVCLFADRIFAHMSAQAVNDS